MKDMINIAEILKDCPAGTKLYSPIFGEIELRDVGTGFISVKTSDDIDDFYPDGRYCDNPDAECLLFPSKDQHDWTKFKVKKEKFDIHTFKPFDKVLVKYDKGDAWRADLFSHLEKETDKPICCGVYHFTNWTIPYNEETAHLMGTTDDCPEYYKWWAE